MLQLRVTSGKLAGQTLSAGIFPATLGRAGDDGLRTVDPGVWDRHLTLTLQPDRSFRATADPGAPAFLNGNCIPPEGAEVRMGDQLVLGGFGAVVQLAPARQHGLVLRETLTWLMIGSYALLTLGLWFALARG